MPTISDVARLAGVSAGTVSRVMNGAENVNPNTRSKVEQAIANLGYQPNIQARSLRNKRTDTIALAIPELTNYFWTTVARGVQDAAQANGYYVLICNTYARSRQHLRYLETIYNRVDGMILSRRSEQVVLTGGEEHPSQQSGSARETPIVFIGQSQAASWNVDNVYSDSVSGAFALTEHLIRLGHRQIAIITGRQSSTSATDRVAGYCLALADAAIPIDPQMICWGEYDRKTAQRLTHELIERKTDITAIVAANNEISIGIIHALEKRDIRVPEAIAVVCFDDFYPDSRFASTMTVAAQSPYDIGMNATQLLLSRLSSSDYLRPRTIVLPLRLIVRQSCGGQPLSMDREISFDRVEGQIIPSLPREKIMLLAATINSIVQVPLPANDSHLIQAGKIQIAALKQALRCEEPDVPMAHFEYAITNRSLYRYVLEREPIYETIQHQPTITPEDQVEFAQRTGIAAIACRFPYQPILDHHDNGWAKDSELSFDFPLLTDQLDFFDRYVRAARNTNVGIAADFRSIFADTLKVIETLSPSDSEAQTRLLHKAADHLLTYQSKVVQLICDRFGAELACVIFSDHLADEHGLRVSLDIFETVFSPRIQHLIRSAQEHGLPTVLHTPGKLDMILPLLPQWGFNGVYLAQPELHDLFALKEAMSGQLSLMGGIPMSSLRGREPALTEDVTANVLLLAAGGGYVAGAAGAIDADVPMENFFSLLRALSALER